MTDQFYDVVGTYQSEKHTLRHQFIDRAVASLDQPVITDIQERYVPVVEWLEEHYYVDRPRDMQTAAILPVGPIRLADYQKRVLREAFRRDADGKLVYSTVVWSEPKKSGKTAIAGGAGLYMAHHTDASYVYCLANDGKQSKDRIFHAMARCFQLHQFHNGIYKEFKVVWNPPKLKFPSGSQVEAIPCDAAGEAGAEPLMTIWSEMWGFQQTHKERLWTEMTIPPTLYGYAMRWVESYAGYEDESTTLWMLYNAGVNNGERHPAFPNLPVYVNKASNQLTFWSEEPRMPWQTKDYYANEATLLTPNEFQRVHRNQWVTATTSLFDDDTHWDKCEDASVALPLKPGDMTPVVFAIDASVSGDCCAIVGVTRHPDDEWDAEIRRVVERYVGVWYPPKGGKIDHTSTIQKAIVELCSLYNVYRVVYDPYQLHKMCTDLKNAGVANFKEFSQHGRRLAADKQLYDMLVHQQYFHGGNPEAKQHMRNTAAKAEGKHIRFVKKSSGRPIDLMVATSMATDECLRLNV